MATIGRKARMLRRDERGATAVEFAILSGAFFFLLLGIIEYGMISFSKVVIESVLQQAARDAVIGKVVPGCSDRVCTIKKVVQDKTASLIKAKSVQVDARVVSNPTQATVPVPDICLDDENNPYSSLCTKFLDNNGIPGYQQSSGLTSIGSGGDLVEVRVTYLWRVLFPVFRSYFGSDGVLTISASTVIKNEPY